MVRPRRSPRFIAFISYKHAVSTGFAERLEAALMNYAKPLLARPHRVFRDERYIVPTTDLPALIRDSLDQSGHLILLASPEAAMSPWVQSELQIFCELLGRRDRLIIVLTAGEIIVDVPAGKVVWDPTKTTALPALLERWIPGLPFWIDLRAMTTPDQLSLSHPDFRREVNRMIAHMRGLTPDDMIGVELRVWRRNRRIAVGTVIVLGLAALALALLSVRLGRSNAELDEQRLVAEKNEAIAVDERARSERLRTISEAELTAAQARISARETSHLALELAASAWDRRPARSSVSDADPRVDAAVEHAEFEVAAATAAVLGAHPGLRGHLRGHMGAINTLSIGEDGTVVSAAQDPFVVVWDLDHRTARAVLRHPRERSLLRAVHRRAELVVAASPEDLVIWGGETEPRVAEMANISALALHPRDDLIAVGTGPGDLSWIDLRSMEVTPLGKRGGMIAGLAFSPDGRLLYASAYEQDGRIDIWDVKTGKRLPRALRGHAMAATKIVPAADGALVAATSEFDELALWDRKGRLLERWRPGTTVTGVAFAARPGHLHAVQADGMLSTWVRGRSDPVERRYAHRGGAYALVVEAGRDLVMTGGADGVVRLWSADPYHPLISPVAESDGYQLAVWSGERIITTTASGLRVLKPGEGVLEEVTVALPSAMDVRALGGPGPLLVVGPPYEATDHDLLAWSMQERAVVTTLANKSRWAKRAVISALGDVIAAITPGQSGGVLLWSLGAREAAPFVCRVILST